MSPSFRLQKPRKDADWLILGHMTPTLAQSVCQKVEAQWFASGWLRCLSLRQGDQSNLTSEHSAVSSTATQWVFSVSTRMWETVVKMAGGSLPWWGLQCLWGTGKYLIYRTIEKFPKYVILELTSCHGPMSQGVHGYCFYPFEPFSMMR